MQFWLAELSVVYTNSTGTATVYEGTLRFSGDRFALTMDDTVLDVRTALGVQPRSQMLMEIESSIAAVDGA